MRRDIYLDDEAAAEDLLGYQPYVKALFSTICTDDLKTPFVIGIYGKWGSGKSSLMNFIKEKIRKEKKGNISTIWFTPWQYQNQPNLLAPLFLTFIQSSKDFTNTKARFKTFGNEINKLFHVSAEYLLELLTAPLLDVARIKDLGKEYEGEKDIQGAPAFKDIVFLHRLKSEFEKMVQSAVGDEGKLVVFVDDLDRCHPEKVLEMLESIKLFLGVKRCIFIIGLNYDILAHCIRTKYKRSTGDTYVDVDEYVEKIIQLPFRIPALAEKDIQKFINSLEKDKQIGHVGEFFSKFLPKNPRKVKKVLNVFRLTVKLAKHGKLFSDTGKKSIILELLAKIIVIRERWLSLHTQYENDPELLKTHETAPEAQILQGIRNRKELIELFKYGKERFASHKNLHQYFRLSESTSITEVKAEISGHDAGVGNVPPTSAISEGADQKGSAII